MRLHVINALTLTTLVYTDPQTDIQILGVVYTAPQTGIKILRVVCCYHAAVIPPTHVPLEIVMALTVVPPPDEYANIMPLGWFDENLYASLGIGIYHSETVCQFGDRYISLRESVCQSGAGHVSRAKCGASGQPSWEQSV